MLVMSDRRTHGLGVIQLVQVIEIQSRFLAGNAPIGVQDRSRLLGNWLLSKAPVHLREPVRVDATWQRRAINRL